MSIENAIIVQAKYAFEGQNNDELRFQKGDKITLTQKVDGGWWEGTLNQKTGWFPSNYVKELKEVVSPISPSTQKRQYYSIVLHDLIESEKVFIAEMQELITKFLLPLKKGSVSILNDNEYRQLTGNILEVLDVHKSLLSLLEEHESSKSLTEQKIGKLFLTWAPKIKSVHQTYCSLHPKAACILDKFKDELGEFMESCNSSSPGILVLTTGLSKPFRRIDKYSGILKELERHIEESHPDRGDTQRSAALYSEIASVCAATRRQKELELQVLTGPVRGWEGPSLAQLGEIIHMGSVAVGPQHHDRYLVLFTNNLLILSVSQRMSAFIYEGKLPLTGIKLKRIDDNEVYKNAFEISGPLIEPIIAICQSKNEAQYWVDILKSHASRDSRTSLGQSTGSPLVTDLQSRLSTKTNGTKISETMNSKIRANNNGGLFYGLRASGPYLPNFDNFLSTNSNNSPAKLNRPTLNDDEDLSILRVIEAYCPTHKSRSVLVFDNLVAGSNGNSNRGKHDLVTLYKSGSDDLMSHIQHPTIRRTSSWCCGDNCNDQMLINNILLVQEQIQDIQKNIGQIKHDLGTEKSARSTFENLLKSHLKINGPDIDSV